MKLEIVPPAAIGNNLIKKWKRSPKSNTQTHAASQKKDCSLASFIRHKLLRNKDE